MVALYVSVAEQLVPRCACFFGKNDPALHRIVFHVWIARSQEKAFISDAGLPADQGEYASEDTHLWVETERWKMALHLIINGGDIVEPASSWVRLRELYDCDYETLLHIEGSL